MPCQNFLSPNLKKGVPPPFPSAEKRPIPPSPPPPFVPLLCTNPMFYRSCCKHFFALPLVNITINVTEAPTWPTGCHFVQTNFSNRSRQAAGLSIDMGRQGFAISFKLNSSDYIEICGRNEIGQFRHRHNLTVTSLGACKIPQCANKPLFRFQTASLPK
jgi:hypothetical protein